MHRATSTGRAAASKKDHLPSLQRAPGFALILVRRTRHIVRRGLHSRQVPPVACPRMVTPGYCYLPEGLRRLRDQGVTDVSLPTLSRFGGSDQPRRKSCTTVSASLTERTTTVPSAPVRSVAQRSRARNVRRPVPSRHTTTMRTPRQAGDLVGRSLRSAVTITSHAGALK